MAKEKPLGSALCCLGKDTLLRKCFFKLARDDKFDAFVIICILVSTVSLVFQNNRYPPDATDQIFFKTLDLITTLIFALESCIKSLALGFICNGPTSYLRKWANVFDFIIVLSAILSML